MIVINNYTLQRRTVYSFCFVYKLWCFLGRSSFELAKIMAYKHIVSNIPPLVYTSMNLSLLRINTFNRLICCLTFECNLYVCLYVCMNHVCIYHTVRTTFCLLASSLLIKFARIFTYYALSLCFLLRFGAINKLYWSSYVLSLYVRVWVSACLIISLFSG